MNALHQQLLKEFEAYPKGKNFNNFSVEKYLGTPRPIYNLPNAKLHKILRYFKHHRSLTHEELLGLVTSLYDGESATERMAASLLLGVYPKIRKELDPHLLDKWLSKLAGWVEIDTLCQSTFTASELLQEWDIWLLLLREFNKSSDISKRRASLVLLVKPVRESADPRLAKIAFENIDRLRFEKEILITKAISWLLRVLIKHHRTEVEAYLTKRAEDLPKIALRETHKKLDTGKKN